MPPFAMPTRRAPEAPEPEPKPPEPERAPLFTMPTRAPKPAPDDDAAPPSQSAPSGEPEAAAPDSPAPPPPSERAEAWRALVEAIRVGHAPLAATLEHAHVEEFSATRLKISLVERFFHLLPDDESRAPLLRAIEEAHGASIELVVTLRFDAESLPGNETLAEKREAELRRPPRRARARPRAITPSVREANRLFPGARDAVRVALREDEA